MLLECGQAANPSAAKTLKAFDDAKVALACVSDPQKPTAEKTHCLEAAGEKLPPQAALAQCVAQVKNALDRGALERPGASLGFAIDVDAPCECAERHSYLRNGNSNGKRFIRPSCSAQAGDRLKQIMERAIGALLADDQRALWEVLDRDSFLAMREWDKLRGREVPSLSMLEDSRLQLITDLKLTDSLEYPDTRPSSASREDSA